MLLGLLLLCLKVGLACLGILICNTGRGNLCPCRCVMDTASLRSENDSMGPTMDMGYGAEEYFVDCRLAHEHTSWELVFVTPDGNSSTTEE